MKWKKKKRKLKITSYFYVSTLFIRTRAAELYTITMY